MCGISGYIGTRNYSKKEINNFLEEMKSRGPDSQNYFISKDKKKNNIYLFHSRLNIIDLTKNGNQPFTSSATRT